MYSITALKLLKYRSSWLDKQTVYIYLKPRTAIQEKKISTTMTQFLLKSPKDTYREPGLPFIVIRQHLQDAAGLLGPSCTSPQ